MVETLQDLEDQVTGGFFGLTILGTRDSPGGVDMKNEVWESQGRDHWGEVAPGVEVYDDVWGNICIGLLSRKLGVSDIAQVFGANVYDTVWGGVGDIGDDISIGVGRTLDERTGGDWSLLTPEMVLEEILAVREEYIRAAEPRVNWSGIYLTAEDVAGWHTRGYGVSLKSEPLRVRLTGDPWTGGGP